MNAYGGRRGGGGGGGGACSARPACCFKLAHELMQLERRLALLLWRLDCLTKPLSCGRTSNGISISDGSRLRKRRNLELDGSSLSLLRDGEYLGRELLVGLGQRLIRAVQCKVVVDSGSLMECVIARTDWCLVVSAMLQIVVIDRVARTRSASAASSSCWKAWMMASAVESEPIPGRLLQNEAQIRC